MGKKSKKRRGKNKYTLPEFRDILCAQCGLCPKGTEPTFCFGHVYGENRRKFIKSVFKNLIELKRWFVNTGYIDLSKCSDEDLEYFFTMAFCGSNYCGQYPGKGQACENVAGCMFTFRKQVMNLASKAEVIEMAKHRGRKKNKRKKNKFKEKRYVAQPYPTFFCNDGFKEEVQRILHGAKDK